MTDGAGVLPAAEVRSLNRSLEAYEDRTGHQVVVWIGKALPQGIPIETFALRAFSEWGLGRKHFDDGVALFVFPDSHRARIAVGFGLEDEIPDAEAVRIIREEIAPRTREGRWVAGIGAGVDAIIDAIEGRS